MQAMSMSASCSAWREAPNLAISALGWVLAVVPGFQDLVPITKGFCGMPSGHASSHQHSFRDLFNVLICT